MNTATTVDDIPAPPAPGQADALDEVLVGLPHPPRARRRVLAVLLSVIPAAALFLASQMVDDVRYAMAPTTAVTLGDGRTADPATVGLNRYVTLRASPSMAGAVTYSRPLWPGEHLVFPVAGRDGAPIYVQVSQEGAQAMSRGEFRGRLTRFGGAGGRYAGVGHYLHGTLRAPVDGDTWLLVDGATPTRTLWAPMVATLLVAIALTDLGLLRRLYRRGVRSRAGAAAGYKHSGGCIASLEGLQWATPRECSRPTTSSRCSPTRARSTRASRCSRPSARTTRPRRRPRGSRRGSSRPSP